MGRWVNGSVCLKVIVEAIRSGTRLVTLMFLLPRRQRGDSNRTPYTIVTVSVVRDLVVSLGFYPFRVSSSPRSFLRGFLRWYGFNSEFVTSSQPVPCPPSSRRVVFPTVPSWDLSVSPTSLPCVPKTPENRSHFDVYVVPGSCVHNRYVRTSETETHRVFKTLGVPRSPYWS